MTNEIQNLWEIYEKYCQASGQRVNKVKSILVLSRNASQDLKKILVDQVTIENKEEANKYLGLPTMWERSKGKASNFLKERIRKKKYKIKSRNYCFVRVER